MTALYHWLGEEAEAAEPRWKDHGGGLWELRGAGRSLGFVMNADFEAPVWRALANAQEA